MSTANQMQVDGEHYQSTFQHWDMITDGNFGYLEGCATKYLTRWREKAGIPDLLKAEHFIIKLYEKATMDKRFNFGKISPPTLVRYLEANRVGRREGQIIDYLLDWQTPEHLIHVVGLVSDLIKEEGADADRA